MTHSLQTLRGIIYEIVCTACEDDTDSERVDHATDAIIEVIVHDRQARGVR